MPNGRVQRADLTCHVIRKSLRLCCVDQSGTSIQILQEPRDTFFFIKLRLYWCKNPSIFLHNSKLKLNNRRDTTMQDALRPSREGKLCMPIASLEFRYTYITQFGQKCNQLWPLKSRNSITKLTLLLALIQRFFYRVEEDISVHLMCNNFECSSMEIMSVSLELSF